MVTARSAPDDPASGSPNTPKPGTGCDLRVVPGDGDGRPSSGPVVIATIMRPVGTTGVQTHTRQCQHFLETAGAPATLVTPFSWAKALSTPVFGVRLVIRRVSRAESLAWYRYWHHLFLRRALRLRLRRLGPCVVYAQCPLSAKAALEARLSTDQHVVMAVHFRGSQADEWSTKDEIRLDGRIARSIRRLETSVLPRLDGIVFLSEQTRAELIARITGLEDVPGIRLPNFVSPVDVTPGRRVADLVTVGTLERFKNHDFLLDVLVEAKRRGSVFTLDVIGTGPRRDDLERRAVAVGVGDQVRFLGPRPNAQGLLSGYGAYVHASTMECLPLVLIEAMSAGLPVLAGPVGGIPELVDDGVEGSLWPLDDPTEAADRLIRLLGDEDRRSQAGAAARQRFEREFSAEVVGPRLREFLSDPR